MNVELISPIVRQIRLPNHDLYKINNSERGKKINLQELFNILCTNPSFKSSFDVDVNPRQNWVTIQITGQAKIFSNGTVTTNLNLPEEALIEFFAKFYQAYIKEAII